MSFLFPLWLWAAAAVAVPLVIHLLSRGRGRIIAVGTVRFLPATKSHRLRRIRPSNLLRFLLRAALIASLALALAGPRYWSPAPLRQNEHWVFVDPALLEARARLEAVAPDLFHRLDSTTATERRLLAPDLPAWDGGQPTTADSADLWSLATDAAALAPAGAVLEIFVLDRAEALRGARPDLGRPVGWWTVTDPEPNRWIQRLVRTPDGLRATIGTSSADGTRFTSLTGSLEAAGLAPHGADELRLVDGGSQDRDDLAPAPTGQPPLRISVSAADGRERDANAVRQAATAVARHLGRATVVAPTAGEPVDLAVGLGTSADLTDGATVRLVDLDAGDPCRQSVWVEALPDPWLELRRCDGAPSTVAHWRAGQGQPLLSSDSTGSDIVYRWHGRFDPAWSNLPENGLPHLLLALIAPDDAHANGAGDAGSDRRAPIAGHSRPLGGTAPPPTRPNPLPEQVAWIVVALLFLTDRLLVRSRA